MNRFSSTLAITIWRKELLDIVRDKRTLISMVVIPILLMPLMMVGMGLIIASTMQSLQERTYQVAVVGEMEGSDFGAVLAEMERMDFIEYDEEVARALLEEGGVEVVVLLPRSNVSDLNSPEIRILSRQNKETSGLASSRIVKHLEKYRERLVDERVAMLDAPANLLEPFILEEENIATDEQMATSALASFLPYVLILMTLSGAVYPAIDMTAGEKERATLETLLATPVGRLEIVIGKFTAIMTTSIISAMLSLGSLIAAMEFGANLFNMQMGESISFSFAPLHILYAVCMMVPLAAMFSALLMTICLFAKGTREAQSYVTPMMFVVIVPAMMSIMPGSEGTVQKAWMPIVNVSLVLKDMLNGTLVVQNVAITLLSTVLYAGLALAISVKVFERENVLFRV